LGAEDGHVVRGETSQDGPPSITATVAGREPGTGARSRIIPRAEVESAPLSFVQERLWFFDQFVPGCPAYNSFRALRLGGPLDISALQRTLDALVARHETLRTTFPVVGGSPRQEVNQARPVPLPVLDLGNLCEDERDAALREQVVPAARQPFDLSRDP